MKDGYLNKCKKCTKVDSISHRSNNIDYYKAYDKIRSSLPHRVKARKDYSKTDAFKKSHKVSARKWVENNSDKRAAHVILNNRLKRGLVKKEKCLKCGNKNSQAHHEDYSKPLKVKWLCAKCHAFRHKVIEIKLGCKHETKIINRHAQSHRRSNTGGD